MISLVSGRRVMKIQRGDLVSGAALFVYALSFSFAYIRLDVGTGALILFALVQMTMVGFGLARGERPRPLRCVGFAVALGGLVYLVSPGLSAPSPPGAVLMAAAGLAWGVYSLRGRGAADPVTAATGSFLLSVPIVIAAAVIWLEGIQLSAYGAALALASGALASGAGYAVWHVALRGLSASGAATVQLTVPVLAAAGGVLLLNETVSLRFVLSAVFILGGVGLALSCRREQM
jgi:drug/metabolite transporter (DMT)-like permease